jgi:acetyl-CoA C-acetyltransferase
MATASDPVVIVSAARTPLGRFMGDLSPFSAHKLGSHVIGAAVERAKLAPERIDEVFMGCVLPAGQGQAPARQAARGAKLPDATGATTINKVCGSGMKATMLAHDIIQAGSAEIVVSGGMESMTNAPYLLAKARAGYRAGHDRIIDHMVMDGLEDAYEAGRSMGDFGEATAEAYQFTRADQDAYAMETLTRARKAVEGGAFKAEIVPITVTEKAGPRSIGNDEIPLKVDPARIPGLKPAFRANGTITPAASSANADGAAALILTKRSLADRDGLPTLAVIRGHATHSQEPQWFTTAPIPAIRKLLDKVGWGVGDVDLFEINEARSRHPARQTQHQRRRLRARPSDRRHRRPPDRDAAACAGGTKPEARRRRAVHRRRRSHRHRHRAHRSLAPFPLRWNRSGALDF